MAAYVLEQSAVVKNNVYMNTFQSQELIMKEGEVIESGYLVAV